MYAALTIRQKESPRWECRLPSFPAHCGLEFSPTAFENNSTVFYWPGRLKKMAWNPIQACVINMPGEFANYPAYKKKGDLNPPFHENDAQNIQSVRW
jgi:hypothetical protein